LRLIFVAATTGLVVVGNNWSGEKCRTLGMELANWNDEEVCGVSSGVFLL
jgi:hypothetical protein